MTLSGFDYPVVIAAEISVNGRFNDKRYQCLNNDRYATILFACLQIWIALINIYNVCMGPKLINGCAKCCSAYLMMYMSLL